MKQDDKINQRHPGKPSQIGQNVLLACLAMASGVAAAPVFAQSANTAAPALEEVIVSARKRNEQLLEVPISILAVSEKEIRAAGVSDLTDLAATAGFTFNGYSGTSAFGRTGGQITFRGLQSHTALSNDASGSLFIDGIFVSSGQGSVNTSDLERIEVLKGPQNAFFGRSTFGGAINYVTKSPANTFQGQINASASNDGSSTVDATVEGPLKEGVAKGRLQVYSMNKAAPYHATDGGDMGAQKTTSITGTLVVTPTKDTWFRFRGHSQRDDDSTAAVAFLTAQGNTSCTGKSYAAYDLAHNPITFTPGVAYFCDGIPGFDSKYVNANTGMPSQFASVWQSNSLNWPFFSDVPKLSHTGMIRDVTRLSLQGGTDLPGNWEFVFNIGYNSNASMSAWDMDKSANNNFFSLLALRNRDLTMDARLSSDKSKPIRGLIGVSQYKGTEQLSQADWYAYLGATSMSGSASNYLNYEITVPALYGSIDADVTNDITVSLEARQQKDKIVSNTLKDATPAVSSEKSNLLPRLTARYKLKDGGSVYASYAEGVQPLSVNQGYINATAAGKAYLSGVLGVGSEFSKQPKVNTFEIGIKQRLLDNRLQYSAAAYAQKWKNAAILTSVFNDVATCGVTTFNTAACPLTAGGASLWIGNDATINGIEFAADMLLSSVWSAAVTVDYKSAKWDKYYYATNSSQTNPAVFGQKSYFYDGSAVRGVPKWQWTANSTYRFPSLVKGFDGYVRGDVIYQGETPDTEPTINKFPGYYRANLRFGLEKKDMTLELFVKNVLDDRHWTYGVRSADLSPSPLLSYTQMGLIVGVPEPRTVGIRTNFKF